MSNSGAGFVRVAALVLAASMIWGCEGDDGESGPAGPAGPAGPPGPAGPAAPPPSTAITIGDGGALTADQVATLGKLQATILGVTVNAGGQPEVEFRVLDASGSPAVGLDAGAVRFTFAKLVVPTDDTDNGGVPYWQSYINEAVVPDQPTGPNVLANAVQATTESGGSLDEVEDGRYLYTFANDVTNITDPIAVPWEEPFLDLTHRVGLEIRLGGVARRPMAPDNPVFDFVPSGNAGLGATKNIVDTNNCEGCHYEFAFHGGQRKTMEYCVTCHNPGHVDADSGNSLDFGHMVHSIHMGADRPAGSGASDPKIPYIIYRNFGGDDRTFDFGEVHFPQSQTYCESCHFASEAAPDGDAWNEQANARACGGCHADGLVAENFDPVTGKPDYFFDHSVNADFDLDVQADGDCAGCHLGAIPTAGTALSIHSRIENDQRWREELGGNFLLSIEAATSTGPGETPVITFSVRRPDGTAYDIVNDPEFNAGGDSSLNLYVAWTADEIYNGDELGATLGLRDNGTAVEPYGPGLPHRMDLAALKRDITANPGWVNADGSYTVTYFTALPANITGDAMISLAGHPAAVNVTNADNEVIPSERGAAVSAVFFPGAKRQVAVATEKCQACHKQLQAHGTNRNGNVTMCLNCHTGDNVTVENVGGVDIEEGYGFGRMIHSIHAASTTFLGGFFAETVHFPQNIANCDACHKPGLYDVARAEARAVSISGGTDTTSWADDAATSPNAAVCGACHNDIPSMAHFSSMGAQIGVAKSQILTVNGLPNGQESCAVCHAAGSEFDTSKYHNPGL